MSYKVEVKVPGESSWHSNAIRLGSQMEATFYGTDLLMRWTAVQDFRVVESDDPVNYVWTNNQGLLLLTEDRV